jgi:hypothetical protein
MPSIRFSVEDLTILRSNIIAHDDRSSYISPLTDDFKNEVRRKTIAAIRNNERRFPIAGNVSLVIDISTSSSKVSIGVKKTLLDALSGFVYTDDCIVSSILVRTIPTESLVERLRIRVINGQDIMTYTDDPEDYSAFTILDYSFETVLEDNYLPYAYDADARYVTDVVSGGDIHSLDEASLRERIVPEGLGLPDGELVAISVEATTPEVRADVDNVLLGCLIGLYQDIPEVGRVGTLHARVARDSVLTTGRMTTTLIYSEGDDAVR